MKRLTVLLLAMALCLGSIGAAKADDIDIKVRGQWEFAFGFTQKSFRKSVNGQAGEMGYGAADDSSVARQRVRTQIDFITSEYLSAVLMFEIGDLRWGSGNGKGRQGGADLDSDGVNIETKRAYLDWIIPYTEVSVRMGIQGLTLPSTSLGSPVFDADVAAITVSAPITDWLSAAVFWARPFDQYYNDDNDSDFGDKMDDETDMFGILLPMNFSDIGVSFTPWYVYSWVGANSGIYDYLFAGSGDNSVSERNSSTKAWWIGGNFGFTLLDPLEFNMDFMYGRLNRAGLSGFGGAFAGDPDGYQGPDVMASGWFLAATLDYRLDFMTPGIFGWYGSGDTASGVNGNRIGRMPVLGTDGGFAATSFGMNGYYHIGNGDNNPAVVSTGMGTWGIGIQLADVTFIEDLSHTLRFAYYRGTNDSDVVENLGNGYLAYDADPLYLTDKDQVFEVNFDHQYQIYENLTMVLELGYIHLKSDKDVWRVPAGSKLKDNDDAWKAEINFRYSF